MTSKKPSKRPPRPSKSSPKWPGLRMTPRVKMYVGQALQVQILKLVRVPLINLVWRSFDFSRRHPLLTTRELGVAMFVPPRNVPLKEVLKRQRKLIKKRG